MKKIEVKATHKYELYLWSAKHFDGKLNPRTNIYQGMIKDLKTKKQFMFSNSAGFLMAIDKLYRNSEGRKSTGLWKVKRDR